jgi:ubiquitin C-terminal hydrolase
MNACLQCLIPITTLRDYYINQEFKRFHDKRTIENSNDYSRKFSEFFGEVFQCSAKDEQYLNPTMLKNLIRKKFFPSMQHDVHEFLMHMLSTLQDEETPVDNKKFDGDVSAKNKNRSLA